MREWVEDRVLAAIEFVDAVTGARITQPLQLHSEQAKFIKNRSFQYIVAQADGLSAHSESFLNPPNSPPLQSVNVALQIVDPAQRYLPRRFNLALPRDPDPDNRQQANSLFQAIDCTLYRDVNAKTLGNWSLLRVQVFAVDGGPLVGGFLRVMRDSDNHVLAEGFSNGRGEALVIVPGIPITQFSSGEEDDESEDDSPVLVNEVPAQVELSVSAGHQDWPVNPDTLAQNHSSNIVSTQPIQLKTGRTEIVQFDLSAS